MVTGTGYIFSVKSRSKVDRFLHIYIIFTPVVKPPFTQIGNGLMSNPFKKISDTSRETAKKWDNTKITPAVQTITCPQCAAPRPVNTNIASCAYCGFRFMDLTVIIKPEQP
jgi:hypothetical protein